MTIMGLNIYMLNYVVLNILIQSHILKRFQIYWIKSIQPHAVTLKERSIDYGGECLDESTTARASVAGLDKGTADKGE